MKKIILMLSLSLCFNAFAEDIPCGDDCTWSYDETTKTLTITGSGAIRDYGGESVTTQEKEFYLAQRPWAEISSQVENIVVDGFSSIGKRAFQNMENLKNITIGDSVTSVGRAFLAYTPLTTINLPNSITTIEPHAFTCLSNLENIVIPDSVTSIGTYAFWGASNLMNLVIPSSVTSIEDDAFVNTSMPIYCATTSPCSNKGSENIISYQQDSTTGLYQTLADGKYFATADLMAKGKACENEKQCEEILETLSAGKDFVVDGRLYSSLADWANGNYAKKRIYTVEEATKLSKPTGNTFKLRYK